MTIKELEQRTGMARANIRFYEGEGLLAPKRLENGYRDYSEEDARTLEKIKLLRQLQLDIDTIRKVQQGALTLEQALFTQLTRLEGDKLLIERAAEVCRELETSGVEYAALEPQPWLTRLEAPPAGPALPPAPPPRPVRPEVDDTPRACCCPWQRFFARMLDMNLYSTVFNVLLLVLFRAPDLIWLAADSAIAQWFLNLLLLCFTLAVEPLWLHLWGWTPGKWLFGLKLRDGHGNKLRLNEAFHRSRQVLWEGYGLNIPVYSQWRLWKSRETSLDGRDCYWDGQEGHRYTKEERRFSAQIFVAAPAVMLAVLALAVSWSYLPPCQGPLDVPEFAQNYNHCLRLAGRGGWPLTPTLDSQGQWVKWEQPPNVVTVSMFGDTTVYEKPEYTLSNGVTAVTLRMSSRDIAVGDTLRERLVLLSLCRSAGELNLFNILSAQRDAAALLDRWEDFEEDFLGVHISQQVASVGYEPTNAFGAQLWCEDEDAPHHCEKTVTFSIIPNGSGGSFPPPSGQAD